MTRSATVLRFIREVGQRAQVATAPPVVEPSDAPPHLGGSHLELAADHADMGTVVSPDTRLRFVKRSMGRLLRHFTHHQVVFNGAVLEELAATRHELAEARREIAAQARTDVHVDERLALSLAALDAQLEGIQDQVWELEQGAGLAGAHDDPTGRPSRRLDEFYGAFEDTFRGPRETVMSRAEEYLGDLRSAAATGGRVLDLGSGRGEVLELLTSHGIDAYGVDASPSMVDGCRERGLEVVLDDALAHLRSLPDAALAAVTGLHIVEHLDLGVLFEIVDESRRVLRSAGRLILESPNPTTWQVGANTFYLDPTHVRPVHPMFLEFLVANRGFADVEVRYLHRAAEAPPVDEHLDPALREVVERFAEMHGGPQDYAVLGTRPTGA